MQLVIDIETNGLLEDATQIWCIVAKELDRDSWYVWSCGYKEDHFESLFSVLDRSSIIGHNIIAFDIPILSKLLGYDFKEKIIDTLVISRVLDPDREGGHSLEAWMKRIGGINQKVQNESWDKWDPIMLERCKSDVLGTEEVFKRLLKEIPDVT